VEEKEIKAQTEFYKKYRKVFQFGTFARTENGWQVSDEKTTLAGVFYGCRPAAPGYDYLRVKGLQKAWKYKFFTRPQAHRMGQFGSLVKHVAPVSINPNGFILRTADKHFTLPDGEHCGTAYGGALSAGIPMLPAFRGTGYDKDQRTQLDFGSSLYVIER
jgi:alpha-galactosidase